MGIKPRMARIYTDGEEARPDGGNQIANFKYLPPLAGFVRREYIHANVGTLPNGAAKRPGVKRRIRGFGDLLDLSDF